VLEGVRNRHEPSGYGGTQFGGWIVAQALTGLSAPSARGAQTRAVVFSRLLAITFVASIPYTKASHMLTSYLSLFVARSAGRQAAAGDPARALLSTGRVRDARGLQHAAPARARRVHEMRTLHEACPANATGRPLSPRDVILELREQSNAAFAPTGIDGLLGQLLRGQANGEGFTKPVIGHDGVRTETVWSCMQCNACVEICPVGIEQAPIINQLRRRLVEDGQLDPRSADNPRGYSQIG